METAAKVEEVAAILGKLQGTSSTAGAVEKAEESLKGSVQLIEERQNLIKIADQSDSGWLMVQGYKADEIADDSDDKRIARAEGQTEKLKKRPI